MILFRLIALLLIVMALMVLGYDVLTSLGSPDGAFALTGLSGFWAIVHGPSMAAFADFVANTAPEWAQGAINMIMGWPAVAVLGGLGVVLAVLFRRRGYLD
ncbi:MAG TPA: hypothetical protein PLA85_12080 [Micropepsaceae bacterium]|nr:hypothetical protein [Micropepsaceae bacterium]HRK72320.1 hypothetical protein [Micropepsaceae bacterium]